MIPRYTRPEMGAIWTQDARFQCLLQVELAVAEAQAEAGIIPQKAFRDLKKNSKFSVERIEEIERTTKHDIIAFVSCVAENVGPSGRYLHYGMTSSDVLDTALSLQVHNAVQVLLGAVQKLKAALSTKINRHAKTLTAGRTHGMHAEVTTFGLKLSGFLAEIQRAEERLIRAAEQMRVVKLSGAVGTYSTQPPEIEKRVGEILDLKPETVATQVIPRDRHAEMLWSLAMFGAALERLSVELRHLQRTEVGEVVENFTPGQKGSSAMPHKKNPISAENLTGLARLLRAHLGAAMENIALWHERDISHSSVERVIFPDSFILADYACERMTRLIEGLYVDEERMERNMQLSQGQLFSSQVLLALIDKGLTREEAYKMVQRLSHSLEPGDSLLGQMIADAELGQLLSAAELKQIFSGKKQQKAIASIIERVNQTKRARGRNGARQKRTALRR